MIPTVNNIKLEETILASSIIYSDALDELAYRLTAEDFSTDINSKIFKALLTCSQKGYEPDPILISNRIGAKGSDAMAKLLGITATNTNIKMQINKLREITKARSIVAKAYGIISRAKNIEDHEDFVRDAVDTFKDVTGGFTGGRLEHIGKSISKAVTEFERVCSGEEVGIKTGIADIDRQTNGIRRGEYVIIGGRPASGKTSMGLTIVKNMAKQGVKVGIFSIEVKTETVIFKLSSMLSESMGVEIPYSTFRGITSVKKDQLSSFTETLKFINSSNIYINDSSRTTISDLETEVRRFIKVNELDVLVIDHLGIVKDDSNASMKRHERLQGFSMRIAGLLKDCNVAGLIMLQLKRSQNNDMPTMDSLGETSQYEKDAHLIYLLHQPDMQDPTKRILVCAKARDAVSGVYPLNFSTKTTEFTSMAECDVLEYQNHINNNNSMEF